jgi:N,N'-diacetyllegionaminate synthase
MFEKTYIIAEASSNHNGDLQTALELVKSAKRAGADAIKFQDFDLESLFCAPHYEKALGITDPGWREEIRKLAFKPEWHRTIAREASACGIVYFSTPFSFDAVDALDPYVPFFKISSGDITFFPLLERIGSKKKGVFLSTGASNITEIDRAVAILKRYSLPFICIMHCIMRYPTPTGELNLGFIDTLIQRYDLPVGFSDHSLGTEAVPVAVGRGVCAVEKHFTLDKKQEGADHKHSLDPVGFEALVRCVRKAESMIGPSERVIGPQEKKERCYARRGIYSVDALQEGETLSLNKVAFLRPNVSIGAENIDELLGKTIQRPVSPHVPLDRTYFH